MTFQQEIEIKTVEKCINALNREIKMKKDQLNKLKESDSFIEASKVYSELNGLIQAKCAINLF